MISEFNKKWEEERETLPKTNIKTVCDRNAAADIAGAGVDAGEDDEEGESEHEHQAENSVYTWDSMDDQDRQNTMGNLDCTEH